MKHVSKQKLIKIDDFNVDEEKEVKERVERWKQKRREVAENNKLFLKKEKNRGQSKKGNRNDEMAWWT